MRRHGNHQLNRVNQHSTEVSDQLMLQCSLPVYPVKCSPCTSYRYRYSVFLLASNIFIHTFSHSNGV